MERKFYGEEYGDLKVVNRVYSKISTLNDLYNILRRAWCMETAYPSCQDEWVETDPSYGQCAITAMIVNDLFGGSIHRIRVEGGGTHYFNKINGHYIDLTIEQFDLYNIPIEYEPNEEMERKYLGKNLNTAKRYELLIDRISVMMK